MLGQGEALGGRKLLVRDSKTCFTRACGNKSKPGRRRYRKHRSNKTCPESLCKLVRVIHLQKPINIEKRWATRVRLKTPGR